MFSTVVPSVLLALAAGFGLPIANVVMRDPIGASVPVATFGVLALVAAVVGVGLAVRAIRQIEARIQGISQLADSVLTGGLVPLDGDDHDDSLGRLADDLRRIAGALAERDSSLREDAFRQELDSRVQNAMMLAESEPDVYEITRRALDTVVGGRPAELLMADASNAHLRLATSSGPRAPRCDVTSPRMCHAVRRGQTMVYADTRAIDACPKLAGREHDVECAVCVPVNVMGKTVGVLHATTEHSHPFSPQEVRELESIVRHLGAHTGMIRALETSQLQAQTDPLTGLLNRRSLETRSAQILTVEQPAAVIVADLDHFKKLNDTHGHEAGDRALRLYSQILRQTLRPTDLVARFGGEEFVCVLPSIDPQTAANVAERVRDALAQAVQQSGGPKFTSSFGVAGHPMHGLTLDDLVQAADQALYAAKKNGRDRVEVVGSGPDTRSKPMPVESAA